MNAYQYFFALLLLLLGSGLLAQSSPTDPTTWTVEQSNFNEVMTITGVIEINGTEIRDTNYTIAAFINGECRSLGTKPVYVPGVDRYIVTLFVYANSGTDPIEFWVHDVDNDVVLPVTETLPFNSANPIGTLVNPYVFKTLQVNINFAKDDVWCAADSNGYAAALISFGNVGRDYDYTLQWSTGSTNDTIYNLGAGVYYLTVTVENAYAFVDSIEIININRPIQKPSLLAAPGDDVCVGDDVFILAYSNETANPVYYWYDIFNQPLDTNHVLTILNLQSDALYYAQTEVRNCRSELSSISINTFTIPDPNFNILPPVGFIGDTIQFVTSQPTRANATYRWNFGDGSAFDNAPTNVTHIYANEGTYRVTLRVTTAQGCVREANRLVTILKPSLPDDNTGDDDPLLFSFNVNDALCSTDRSGSISTQVFNGAPPVRYQWSNGSTTSNIQNLLPGTYSVTITDGSGKRGVGSATVVAKYPGAIQPPTVIVNGNRPVCESGDVWVAAILNYPEAEVYWYNSPNSTTPLFQGNPLILFNVQDNPVLYVETRVGSCASSRVPVNMNVRQLYSEFNASATIAPPGLGIAFSPIGNDPAQNYLWEFGDGTTATGASVNHIFTNPGLYEVKLTASLPNGCSETSSKIIRITPQSDLGIAFNIQNVRCAEDTTGSISIEIASGTPPYTFAWSNGATGSVLSNLGVGSYFVTITDQAGQRRVQEIAITSENPPINIPTVSINGGEVVCVGEDVLLAALTNVADAEYRWYDAPTGGNLLYNGASFPLNNLQENQQVYVEAFFNGCFSPGRGASLVRVTGPDATFLASAKTINEGDTVNFNALVVANRNTYNWNFGDGTTATGAATQKIFDNTGLFEVTLTVTDSVGCLASTTQFIRVVSAVDMVVSFNIRNVACVNDQNGSISATVFNGRPPFSFRWSNGASGSTLNNLRAGTYVVTVTDARGQRFTETAEVISEVGALQAPTIALVGDSLVCPNESISIYAYNAEPGNFTYHWYDAATGGNLVAVTNALNSLGRDLPDQLYAETRVGACKSETRQQVGITLEKPNTGFTASNTTIIEGNAVTFTPNLIDSTYTYSWFLNDGNISNRITPTHTFATPGFYRVRLDVTSANGCQDSRFLIVNVISTNETALILKPTAPACEGDSTGKVIAEVINGVAPYTFRWSNGATTATIDNLAAGAYTVTFTDANGATITRAVTLEALAKKPVKPTITLNANTPICYKDELLLNGNTTEPVNSYLWFNEAGDLLAIGSSLAINDIAASGTYYLETQQNGCSSERAAVALSVQIPDASFSVSQNGLTSVNEALAFLPTVTTYPSYAWSFGDGNTSTQLDPQHRYTNPGAFDVILTVRDADGCTNTLVREDLVNILPADILQLAFNINNILCAADSVGSVTVTPRAGTPPYTFRWSNGTTTATADNLRAGAYTVTVTDAQGRSSIGNATILNQNIQVSPPVISINGNAPVCKGSDAFILGKNTQFANANTLWFESDTAQIPRATGDLYILRELESSRIIFAQSQVEGCYSPRIPINIGVQAPTADFRVSPSPQVMEGELVQFRLNQRNPAYSYYWQFGDNGWSAAPEPYYFYNLGGKFDVQLTVIDPDGCENTIMKEDFITVNMLSGIVSDSVDIRNGKAERDPSKGGIHAAFFPNPFQQDLIVVLKVETTGHYRIQLLDLLGRMQLQQTLELTAHTPHQLQLATEHLQNGMYLLHIENDQTKIIHKLLKQGL